MNFYNALLVWVDRDYTFIELCCQSLQLVYPLRFPLPLLSVVLIVESIFFMKKPLRRQAAIFLLSS